jgi:hypothetical protein
MKRIANHLIGADPEVFLADTQTMNFVSGIGLIGGTKAAPLRIDHMPGFGFQEDNVMIEFNIPPSNNQEAFIRSIQNAMDQIKVMIPSTTEIKVVASAEFLEQELSHPMAKEFGCEPDYNAYTEMPNIFDEEKKGGTLRTGAGHIHIGYDNPDMMPNLDLVKAMDLFAGIPSVIMDKDRRRKEMYGKAGCFRHKKYGVEYRTLSNFWIQSEELRGWAFRAANRAVSFVNSGAGISMGLESMIIKAINDGDEKIASTIIKDFNLELV